MNRIWYDMSFNWFSVCCPHMALYCFCEVTTKQLKNSFFGCCSSRIPPSELFSHFPSSFFSFHHPLMFCVVCHVHNKQVLTKLSSLALKFTHRSPWRSKTPGFLLCCDNKQALAYGHLLHTSQMHISVFTLYRHLQPCCLLQANMSKSLEMLFKLRASSILQNNPFWQTFTPWGQNLSAIKSRVILYYIILYYIILYYIILYYIIIYCIV